MKTAICLAPVLAIVLAMTTGLRVAHASGPVSVYARVDKVTFEPDADKPERIVISGVFMTATDDRGADFTAPKAGYLYYALPVSDRALALREWSDLKSIAGTRQILGFGSVWFSEKTRVRESGEKAAAPDQYPLGNGVVKVNADQPRAKSLLDYKDR